MTSPKLDVALIGAQKSGTSTFYRNLVNSPVLNFTKQKESNILILSDHIGEIEKSYSDSFLNHKYPKIDVSPKYAQCHLYPGVAEKLYKINPRAKIVFLVRDPIDRIKSHLSHNALRDRVNKSMEEEVLLNSDYYLTSSYTHQITAYLKYFPLEQIKVFQFEKMISDSTTFQLALFDFLGVDDEPINFKPFNVTENRYVIKYHDWIHNHVTNSRVLKLYHLFWWVVSLKPKRVVISHDVQMKLYELLNEDTEEFIQRFNLDRKCWRTYDTLRNKE